MHFVRGEPRVVTSFRMSRISLPQGMLEYQSCTPLHDQKVEGGRLQKTELKTFKIRPIISSHEGRIGKLNWMLAQTLTTLRKLCYISFCECVPISGSLMRVQKGESVSYNTFDVENLYTNLNMQDALETAKDLLESNACCTQNFARGHQVDEGDGNTDQYPLVSRCATRAKKELSNENEADTHPGHCVLFPIWTRLATGLSPRYAFNAAAWMKPLYVRTAKV